MKRLIIVDLSGFIFRAFYAVRPLHSPSGQPVNAVHGVLSMLLKLISDYQPSHFFLARDSRGDSFRKEIYANYKAHRPEPPADLIPQFGIIERMISLMNLNHLSVEKYEADDVIGSACTQWRNVFDEILIASSDKDLMQFVDEKIKMIDTMKGIIYGPQEVYEKMEVWPGQIVDYLSIVGDSSDNIPGMKGIGHKGAVQLLHDYGSLDKCIEMKDEFKLKRIKSAFDNYLQDALLSKELVRIETGIDLLVSPEAISLEFRPSTQLYEFFSDLGFRSVIKKMKDMDYGEYQSQVNKNKVVQENDLRSDFVYTIIDSIDDFIQLIPSEGKVAIYPEYLFAENGIVSLKSLTMSSDGRKAYRHSFSTETNDQVHLLDQLLNRNSLTIVGYDLKHFFKYAFKVKETVNCNFFDVLLAHYDLDVMAKNDINSLLESYVGIRISLEEEQSDMLFGVYANALYLMTDNLRKDLEERKLIRVFDEIDNPLIPVLALMENNGIMLNKNFLLKLEQIFEGQINDLEMRIAEISGHPINLRSPKQVAELLFDKMGLPTLKKTKSGFSTDVDVLEELDYMGLSEIPGLILKHRELEKLLSTYVRVLPRMVYNETGRLHSNFNQHNVATGRLSSDKPNLQNIPVRSENGRLIRKGFIAKPGYLLLSADYSQIELRILAHMSGDPIMVKAFLNDEDIHIQTAAEVSNVSSDKVTKDERAKAKTVNFGLIYGQSSFGLAKTLKISRMEAKEYITKYFERFARVKVYLDTLKELASIKGYSETLYGRKRILSDINSQNRTVKSFAERLAVNSPIQGTAADIIKIAMLRVDARIRQQGLRSKMLLQVHDELIFEVPENELESMKVLIKDEMENVVKLDVPLKIDIGIGVNWFDLK